MVYLVPQYAVRYANDIGNKDFENTEVFQRYLNYFFNYREGLSHESKPDNFVAIIFGLCAKADSENRFRLYKGFPECVVIHELWYNCPTEKEFFTSRGFKWK